MTKYIAKIIFCLYFVYILFCAKVFDTFVATVARISLSRIVNSLAFKRVLKSRKKWCRDDKELEIKI